MKKLGILFLLIITTLFIFSCNDSKHNKATQKREIISFENYKRNTLQSLDSITISQKNKLVQYLKTIRSLASNAIKDKALLSFFKQKIAFQKIKDKELPKEIIEKAKSVESNLISHYITNYNQFYNILMIDADGNIIYTIRKEKALNQNIFDKKFANTLLYKKLKNNTNESFVDFQFYEISNEPSAFFIEPIFEENRLMGWFVLQFSITKINSIFDRSDKLGETGEVILVNKNHYMLTDSRFIPESTILKQQLADNNITEKFKLKEGHKTVTDYRGYKVISSFKVFHFWDSEWLIIAKINQAEVLTDYFKNHTAQFYNCLESALKSRKYEYMNFSPLPNQKEVNIDEIKRIEQSETVHTKGLSTCTGLLVYLPNKFAYLAHISPYDKIYNETKTDIVGHLMNRIDYIEISKAQKQLLKFIIVAPEIATAKNITNRLINEGIFLNQIKLLTKGDNRSSEITYQCGKSDAVITMHINDKVTYLSTSQIPELDNEICL